MISQKWFLFIAIFVFPGAILAQEGWSSFPIRSKAEYDAGLFGGEGEQFLHSIDRCLAEPHVIYLAHDVGGSWKSTDSGETWKKCIDKGLYNVHSQSIAVDPINPDNAFIIVDNGWMEQGTVKQFQGLYKTIDGGTSWEHVLYVNVDNMRVLRNNIAYQATSITIENDSPKNWYAVFNMNGLYKSEKYGEKSSWEKLSYFPSKAHQVVCHPNDSNVIFVAAENGLYKSDNGGSNLHNWKFIGKKVTSVCINKLNGKIYAAVADDGLYVSMDNDNFQRLTVKVDYNNEIVDVSEETHRVVLNQGFPEQVYLITTLSNKQYRTCVSEDGGESEIWKHFNDAKTFPGLNRENGWRRWVDNERGGISPNPQNRNDAIAISRSTIFRCTVQEKSVDVNESATGFTGNAPSWWSKSMAFHPYDPNKFAFFCLDIGPNVTHTGGQWFQERDGKISNWKWVDGLTEWTDSYAGAYQPMQGSSVIVANIGRYNGRAHLMRSEDNGLNWNLVTMEENKEAQMHTYEFIEFDPNNPDYVYAGYQISKDAGKTFAPENFPLEYYVNWGDKPNFRTPYFVGLTNEDGKTWLFAISRDNKTILRSEDKGGSWIKFADLRVVQSSAAFMNGIPVFTAHPSNPNIIYTLDNNRDLLKVVYNPATNSATYTSLNLFQKYADVPVNVLGYNQIACIAIHPTQPDTMYVSMLASGIPGILKTTNGGDSWEIISKETAHLGNTRLFVNPHNGDLYRGSIMGVEKLRSVATNSFKPVEKFDKTLNVFPNPASDKIFIRNKTGEEILFFDLNGRLIRRVFAEDKALIGVDIQNFKSGVYFIQSGTFSSTIIKK